ncbi:MAG: vitamin K epoxide reductase family protein [SAR324 cluster bacterium]|nr:vitamin K epoxide reductase family protein [SAR324 cluster bacterium]
MTDIWEMMDVETITLMLIGVAAISGLQSSMAMAMRHHLFRNLSGKSPCDLLLGSPQAYIGPVPVAFFAAFYYLLLLGFLFNRLLGGEMILIWLSPLVLISLPVTAYYAWLLFFKLRIRCMGCVRIQVINVMIALISL